MSSKHIDSILISYRAESLLEQFNGEDFFSAPRKEQQDVRNRLRQLVTDEPGLNMLEAGFMLQIMLDELFGFSILGPHLRDKNVNCIQVFKNYSMVVYKQGVVTKCVEKFRNFDHLMSIANRLIYPAKTIVNTDLEFKSISGLTVNVSLNSADSNDPLLEILK